MARYLALLLALAWWPCANANDPLPSELPPGEEEIALRTAETSGVLIYRHDQAAAAATDALAKVRGFKRNKQLQGWITEQVGHEILVTFVGGAKGEPTAALYRVRVGADGKLLDQPTILKTPEPLTEFEAAAVKARAVAVTSQFQPCAEKYNPVVLPAGERLDRWVVYMLPATTKRSVVPLGGSYRFDINVETGDVAIRPYTRTCIQLQNDPKAVGLMITHLLDAVPTEVHVFWSIWADKPIYVATPPHGTLWVVDKSAIRLVKRRNAEG